MATVSPSSPSVERALSRFPRLPAILVSRVRRMAQASPVELDVDTWVRLIPTIAGGAP